MLGWGEPNFCNARILGKFGPLGNLSLGRTPAHPKLIILKRIAPFPYIYRTMDLVKSYRFLQFIEVKAVLIGDLQTRLL